MDFFSFFILALPIYLVLPFLFYKKYKRQRRKDPFDVLDIERPAGYALHSKLLDLSMDIGEQIAMMITIAAIFTLLLVNDSLTGIIKFGLLLALFIIVLHYGAKLIKTQSKIYKYREGLKAEQIVGQSLTKLLYSGFHVYHDIPCSNFNIDHVVVCSKGIFAIETKSRRKDTDGKGHRVSVKNNIIEFSSYSDNKIIQQVKNASKWLSKELSSATGESVQVKPMVALPGYFIERKDNNSVPVLNHKQLTSPNNFVSNMVLSEEQIKRVNHQLRQLQRTKAAS